MKQTLLFYNHLTSILTVYMSPVILTSYTLRLESGWSGESKSIVTLFDSTPCSGGRKSKVNPSPSPGG